MKKSLLLFVAIAQMGLLFAQKAAPENWFNLDPKLDKVRGVSTERTYNELLKGKTSKTVVVAVIDGGTEVMHEDLKSVIWVNPNEIPGNNIDDDHNGYVDDINGWNFIGGADGKNVAEDNLELTRLYREYNVKYGKADTTQLDGVEMENYRYYVKLKTKFETSFKRYSNLSTTYTNLSKGLTKMKKDLGKDDITLQEVRDYSTTDPNASKVRELLLTNSKIFTKVN